MAERKRIVCLANSYKHDGSCVAGVELVDDAHAVWVRPVAEDSKRGLRCDEIQYANGPYPQVLDVMEITLARHAPEGHQHENWLLEPGQPFRRVGRIGWEELQRFVHPVDQLWRNGSHSTQGRNDRMPIHDLAQVQSSLRLIKVEALSVRVEKWPGEPVRARATFRYNGAGYALRITDPVFLDRCRKNGLGQLAVGESFLTVSLALPYKGYSYKLIAAVIDANALRQEAQP